jgi:hypothetical protein
MTLHHFRSIFISDLHLGTKNLHSRQLLDCLLHTESDYLYLVGDILDLLAGPKKWYWPKINDLIVDAVFARAGNGQRHRDKQDLKHWRSGKQRPLNSKTMRH